LKSAKGEGLEKIQCCGSCPDFNWNSGSGSGSEWPSNKDISLLLDALPGAWRFKKHFLYIKKIIIPKRNRLRYCPARWICLKVLLIERERHGDF
jgi:hypothetical protein